MLQNNWPETAHSIALEQFIEANPNEVFAAWTIPGAVKSWFGKRGRQLIDAEIDLRPGGEWRFYFSKLPDPLSYFGGHYTYIERDRLLKFTWTYVAETEAGIIEKSPVSNVTVQFEGRDNGTLLILEHEGISTETAGHEVNAGWIESLEMLGKLIGA